MANIHTVVALLAVLFVAGCNEENPFASNASKRIGSSLSASRSLAAGTLAAGPSARIEKSSFSTATPRIGEPFTIQINLRVEAFENRALTAFIHFVDPNGNIVFTDDHQPPDPWVAMTGIYSYTHTITLPAAVNPESVRVRYGVYDATAPSPGYRVLMVPGAGVDESPNRDYEVGQLEIFHATESNRPLVLATRFGARCDGATDDTDALQNAMNAVTAGGALELPAGTCVTTTNIKLHEKSNVKVYGMNHNATVLKATTPTNSAFYVTRGNDVTLEDFQVYSSASSSRLEAGEADGINLDGPDGAVVQRLKVLGAAASGIKIYQARNITVRNNEILKSLADGVHTVESANVTVEDNYAYLTGDDGFSSIGYGDKLNSNITIRNNTSEGAKASGISFEGTVHGLGQNNKIIGSRVAGIRVASIKSKYFSGTVDDVLIEGNQVDKARSDLTTGHPAILVFAQYRNVNNVTLRNNIVTDSKTTHAFEVKSTDPATQLSGITISGNRVQDSAAFPIDNCIGVGPRVSGLTTADNTLNDGPCTELAL